jgi:thiopurine S-methyltransferase
MELSYWQSRWRKGNTGFHMDEGYPGLKNHWEKLNTGSRARVLVPLCGKSIDLVWLARKTGNVTGVEVAEEAVEEFFSEQGLTPVVSEKGRFEVWKAENIELWKGDFFKFPQKKAGTFDLIYDKAALVALPTEMRKRYAEKIRALTGSHTIYLLHHFVYPEDEMNGPPFSVTPDEIDRLFGDYAQTVLEENKLSTDLFPKFRQRGLKSDLRERLLLLKLKEDVNGP